MQVKPKSPATIRVTGVLLYPNPNGKWKGEYEW
nr:MAG TPA: SMODS-associating 2TM, beta-strand rich effector domain [Caudoviricetes sp.]